MFSGVLLILTAKFIFLNIALLEVSVGPVGCRKIAFAIDRIASDLLSARRGDRAVPMDEYRRILGVSRGTVKNAFDQIVQAGGVVFSRHGHEGSIIESVDCRALQRCCLRHEILGIMPLPYSSRYEGLATAVYAQLADLDFNMAYVRGAVGRMHLVESGTYNFAITSRHAADLAIANGMDVSVAVDFGPGSYLSSHVLLFRKGEERIEDGMKVAWDGNSLDQQSISSLVTKGRKVEFVPLRTQQTVAALLSGTIDAGVWNYDAVMENHDTASLSVIPIPEDVYSNSFTSAVVVVRRDDYPMLRLLERDLCSERTNRIIEEVMAGRLPAAY